MRYAGKKPEGDPDVAASRAAVKLAAQSPIIAASIRAALAEENTAMQRKPDEYLVHEYLEDINDPCYFHEFMQRVEAHGLTYLGDAHEWNRAR